MSTPLSARSTDPNFSEASAVSQGEDGVGRLVEELTRTWRHGRPVSAADLLAASPELAANSEVVVRLVYEEICLRQEAGQQEASADLLARYPQHRRQLEMLLECHRLLGDSGPSFPACGETLGPFWLRAELGRGACGRVFLAVDKDLADRDLVLKLTPTEGGEHLMLARLQHSSIVPLYHVQPFPERGLLALCMPYLGGLTLAALFAALEARPPEARTGADVLAWLDWANAASPVPPPSRGVVARQSLATASFAEVLCRLAVWLADALQYAHERGLVHLDLKPDNVLLAADGQPMLLDFHLAQPPLVVSEAAPAWVGGTPGYMAPEHAAALQAARLATPITQPVDGRADLFSLGVILFEALTGTLTMPRRPVRALRRNPQVSPGLARIIARCLEADARRRYATAEELAADLRRHLANQPLQGVSDGSLFERWRKWRRRKPNALTPFGLVLAALLTCLGLGWFALSQWQQRKEEARVDLDEGQRLLREHQHDEAYRVCAHGLGRLRGIPGEGNLHGRLEQEQRRAERGRDADRLHGVVEKMRFLHGTEMTPREALARLAKEAERAWEDRTRLTDRSGAPLDLALEDRIHGDLLDLVVLWADLRLRRLASAPSAEAERRAVLTVLKEAESLCGPSSVLARACRELALEEVDGAPSAPRTAWEHCALGRTLLASGRLEEAAAAFTAALNLQPGDFWSNFYQGVCWSRLGRSDEALRSFAICVALSPTSAECFHNRALAYAALGRRELALQDYDRALKLNPSLRETSLNRGVLHYRAEHYAQAEADLEHALRCGANSTQTHFALALVRSAQGDRAAALLHLDEVLRCQPGHEAARKLAAALRNDSGRDAAGPH